MADSWEILALPSEMEYSTRGDGNKCEEKSNKKEDEDLCGYLYKYGAKGLIKTWKHRWFVFEPRRCQLYYYRNPQDAEPLGSIDISTATFKFSGESDNKLQFEICANERSYLLQAKDKPSKLFWLQQLQNKRREYNKRKAMHSNGQNSRTNLGVLRPTSGLLSDETSVDEDEDETPLQLLDPVEKPSSVGSRVVQETTATTSIPGMNISFTNLMTEIKNWRKSGFGHSITTGEPVQAAAPSSGTTLSTHEGETEKRVSEESPETRGTNFLVQRRRGAFFNPKSKSLLSDSNDDTCRGCKEKEAMIDILKEALSVSASEITTRDAVIQNLNKQLSNAVKENCNIRPGTEESEEDKAQYIEELSRIVKSLQEEKQRLDILLSEAENRKAELEQQLAVLREVISERDKTLVKLSEKVESLEKNQVVLDVAEESLEPIQRCESAGLEAEDIEAQLLSLKETCLAFQEQNRFLNGELSELHRLRKLDEDVLKARDSTISALDAELCKIKSRYLLLLKEFSTALREGDESNKRTYEMVQNLLDDAINNEPSEAFEKPKISRMADKYGFYEVISSENVETLEVLADQLNARSEGAEFENLKMSVGVKWENYLVAQGKRGLTKSDELKSLCRIGIPHEYRAKAWSDLVNLHVFHERTMAGGGYYNKLLKDKAGAYTPASKQIELDLLRTLPNNKYYDRPDSEGTNKLRNILLGYSWHNPAIGYCQGLNRLGAIALLYLKEEDAFWALVAIIEHLMPRDYYSRTLIGAQTDQRVLKDLLEEKAPKLASHFQSVGVDLSLLSFNWFLTVFVDIFPVELTFRVWDTFLYEGNKILFRFALAVFKCCEEDLMKITEPGMAFEFFRRLPKARMNAYKICRIAFHDLNPFRMRNIVIKRTHYRSVLQVELDEFESMRNEYVTHKESEIDSNLCIMSEDED